jgi:hypothetical protein
MVVWISEFRKELIVIFMDFVHRLNITIQKNIMFSDNFALRPQPISTVKIYPLLLNMSTYSEPQNNPEVSRILVALFW